MNAQLGELAIFLLSMAAILITANQFKTPLAIKRITWLFLGAGSIYLLGSIFHPISPWTSRLFLYDATRSVFWIWLVALAGGQALFNRELSNTGLDRVMGAGAGQPGGGSGQQQLGVRLGTAPGGSAGADLAAILEMGYCILTKRPGAGHLHQARFISFPGQPGPIQYRYPAGGLANPAYPGVTA